MDEWRVTRAWGLRILAALALGLAGPGLAMAEEPFEDASVHFEQNATDGDVEVVFKATSGDEGLALLTVLGPDGRIVVDFRAPDATTLGIRHFEFESPEPSDVAGLKAAYPEGEYLFSGTTVDGEALHGSSTLSHQLPATASFVRPTEEEEGVATEGMRIVWTPVAGVSAYVVEIEQEDLGVSLEATLPATATSFSVPRGFLAPDMEYDLGIGTLTKEGNGSFVETSFTTAD